MFKKNNKIYTESDVYEQQAGYWKAQKNGAIGTFIGLILGAIWMLFGDNIAELVGKIKGKFFKKDEPSVVEDEKTTDD